MHMYRKNQTRKENIGDCLADTGNKHKYQIQNKETDHSEIRCSSRGIREKANNPGTVIYLNSTAFFTGSVSLKFFPVSGNNIEQDISRYQANPEKDRDQHREYCAERGGVIAAEGYKAQRKR